MIRHACQDCALTIANGEPHPRPNDFHIQERDEDRTYLHDKIALSLLLQEVRSYNDCFGE